MQKNARPLVERATRFRQRNSVAATVEQRQAQLGFKILDRRGDRRLRAPNLFGRRLNAALGDHRVKANKLVKRRLHRNHLLRTSKLHSFYRFNPDLSSPSRDQQTTRQN